MAEGVETLGARLTLRSGQFWVHHLVVVWPVRPWESPVTSTCLLTCDLGVVPLAATGRAAQHGA